MLTSSYADVQTLAASEAGLDAPNLNSTEFAKFRTWISKRLRSGYEWGLWTDLLRWEKRYFRKLYVPATTYQYADEVYYPLTQKYYQAVLPGGFSGVTPSTALGVVQSQYWAETVPVFSESNWVSTHAYTVGDRVYYPVDDTFYAGVDVSNAVTPGSDPTIWAPLIPFNRYVDYAQDLQTAIGTVIRVRTADERYSTNAQPVAWFPSDLGIQVQDSVPFVHVRFRIRSPRLTGAAFDSTLVYTGGISQIYYSDANTAGNFYDCLTTTTAGQSPITAASKWDLVEIPDFLVEYLAAATVADFLRSDGQNAKALTQDGVAIELLSNQTMRLAQGEDYEPIQVHTR